MTDGPKPLTAKERETYREWVHQNTAKNPVDYELHERLLATIDALTAERDDLQRVFDFRWEADMRAIKRWRAEAPGRELTLPDQADLCVWLLTENAAMQRVVDAAREYTKAVDARIYELGETVVDWAPHIRLIVALSTLPTDTGSGRTALKED